MYFMIVGHLAGLDIKAGSMFLCRLLSNRYSPVPNNRGEGGLNKRGSATDNIKYQ